MRPVGWATVTPLVSALSLLCSQASAGHEGVQLSAQLKQPGWAADQPEVAKRIQAGAPLVVQVLVPLCANRQVNCGSRFAGQPGSLRANLYWGAAFGARRHFDRKRHGWERVHSQRGERPLLEQVVYRRYVAGDAWGRAQGSRIEQLVVLQAIHGSDINLAVTRLFHDSETGGRVEFTDNGVVRRERVSVVGYAGHNRLMDGVLVPRRVGSTGTQPNEGSRPASAERGQAVFHSVPKTRGALPAFVLACKSEQYFGPTLRARGSATLVMTRTFMAPEGYVIDAVVKALGDNLPLSEVRRLAVVSYARWQRIGTEAADWIFAPLS